VCVVALCAATVGSAAAQTPPGTGVLVGEVDKCVNNVEQPLAGASVSAESGYAIVTNSNGQFAMGLPEGQYTITVTSTDGNASRPNVPVMAGQIIDIGIIDVGAAAITGCGPDTDTQAEPTATATVAPTATATPVPPSPTPLPPTATPQPSTDQSSPDMTTPGAPNQPSDTTAPDQQPPSPDDSGGTS
jgi:hypothetical protein